MLPFRIDAVGPCAIRALKEGGRGKVGAVFERSFYLVIDEQWICILPHGGGLGPLNARCSESSLLNAITAPLRIGDNVAIEEKSIRLREIAFSFGGATIWYPETP